ncbi:MAG: hypothetical protein O7H41_15935 [Planctomycetota bacterium]|nr:hypothetical protein [Planctomycetota bacterium]
MIRVSVALALIGVLLMVLGCGQSPNSGQVESTSQEPKFDGDAIAALPVGTQQVDVLEKFGAPQRTRNSEDGTQVWTYLYPSDERQAEANRTRVEEVPLNRRITQAPTSTKLDHVEHAIYAGKEIRFAEQRVTVDQDGNVTVISEGKAKTNAVDLYFRDGKLVKVECEVSPTSSTGSRILISPP